jgi:hypothetical protein
LIETVLVLPLLLLILFNAINFGYFFLIGLNVVAAPRSGVEYAVLGAAAPGDFTVPSKTDITALARGDLTGAGSLASAAPVQVCTKWLGTTGSGANLRASCEQSPNGSASFTPASDPNAPFFVLHRVDVTYSFKPIIKATPFNLILMASPMCTSSSGVVTCKFHRQVSMRVID